MAKVSSRNSNTQHKGSAKDYHGTQHFMVQSMSGDSRNRWVTATSPTVEAVVNPFAAACDQGFLPDELTVLQNPDIAEASQRATEMCEEIAASHGQSSLNIETTEIQSDRDFEAIVDFYRTTLGNANDTTVAVNVTPGRKFISAIAFQAGMQYAADHIYYFYLDSSDFYGRVYPDVPRTGADLIDFTEIFE